MVNAGTFSSGAAVLSLGLSVPETLFAQSIGTVLLVIGLTLNAAAGVKYLASLLQITQGRAESGTTEDTAIVGSLVTQKLSHTTGTLI
jgi:hypothetical protein